MILIRKLQLRNRIPILRISFGYDLILIHIIDFVTKIKNQSWNAIPWPMIKCNKTSIGTLLQNKTNSCIFIKRHTFILIIFMRSIYKAYPYPTEFVLVWESSLAGWAPQREGRNCSEILFISLEKIIRGDSFFSFYQELFFMLFFRISSISDQD